MVDSSLPLRDRISEITGLTFAKEAYVVAAGSKTW